MAETQPPTIVEGATTGDVDDEIPVAAKSAEDRKAAAALSSLDTPRDDESAGKDVDQEAVRKAMERLSGGGAGVGATNGAVAKKGEQKVVKKTVKVDPADVTLLVSLTEVSLHHCTIGKSLAWSGSCTSWSIFTSYSALGLQSLVEVVILSQNKNCLSILLQEKLSVYFGACKDISIAAKAPIVCARFGLGFCKGFMLLIPLADSQLPLLQVLKEHFPLYLRFFFCSLQTIAFQTPSRLAILLNTSQYFSMPFIPLSSKPLLGKPLTPPSDRRTRTIQDQSNRLTEIPRWKRRGGIEGIHHTSIRIRIKDMIRVATDG